MSRRDIALELYNSFKNGRKTFTSKRKLEPNRDADDPKSIGELIDQLVSQRDWKAGLSEGEIFVRWQEVVGEEIASKSEPTEIRNEKLFIQCASTAWATQLNLIKKQLLESIQKVAPGIKELEIIGPNAPSWRKGLRTIQGFKGPRDTYG
jgi:predicted nucleic acid-binding Zn ribbon protein